jgi:hypothetical protein
MNTFTPKKVNRIGPMLLVKIFCCQLEAQLSVIFLYYFLWYKIGESFSGDVTLGQTARGKMALTITIEM